MDIWCVWIIRWKLIIERNRTSHNRARTDQRLSAYLKKCLGMQKVREKDNKGND